MVSERGDDYKNHVKCITEDQKYGGKGYEGKTHKGDVKQQAWIQKINELIKRPSVSPKVRELLEQISGFDNVPRKKAKFQNWMKNSLKVHNESILEQVWNIFSEASSNEPVGKKPDQQPLEHVARPHGENATSVPSSQANESMAEPAEAKKNKRERKEERQKKRKKEKKELKLENHQENSKSQKPKKRKAGQEAEQEAKGGDTTEATSPTGKKQQRKGSKAERARPGAVDGAAEAGAPQTSPGKRKRKHSEGKFNWKGTIKAVLKQAPDNEMTIKKLRKKVLAQYYAVTDEHHKSEEELLVIFNKKVSKNPTFKLLKDKIKLLK
ncbi:cell growth-regulating nucleolar protein-like protein [Camelus ferus]|nr:cell growth-regulating nucleolar protein-like protein [Camelus ferus]